jgi:hypothetical protein
MRIDRRLPGLSHQYLLKNKLKIGAVEDYCHR